MRTVPLDQADRAVTDLIERLPPGEDVVQTRGGRAVATIRAMTAAASTGGQRRLGTLRGSVLSVAPDFDHVPAGFEDYLP